MSDRTTVVTIAALTLGLLIPTSWCRPDHVATAKNT